MTDTKYPLAAHIGETVELGLVAVADPVERELYGTTRYVVNAMALKAVLVGAGYYKVNSEALETATAAVESRLAVLH